MSKHKTAIILTLAAFLSFFILPGIAHADGGPGGAEMEVNGYHVQLVFPSPAKTGENQFHVRITAPDGSPVDGAEVEVAAQPVEETQQHQAAMAMAHDPTPASAGDGMSGMSGMNAPQPTAVSMNSDSMAGMDDQATIPVTVALQAGHGAGEYAGAITFSQPGHCMLAVHFTANGEKLKTEFPLDVASNIPVSYGILAGFFGLNAVIVVSAAATRRKTIPA